MTDLPKFSFTARDFDTIRAEFLAFIKQTRPDIFTDFVQNDLGVMLVEQQALMGDMLSFGQDQIAAEIFLSSCRRYSSGLRSAKSVGYTPRGAAAALATLKSTNSLPASLIAYGGVIPAGTQIKGQNGLIYELVEDYTVTIGDAVVRLTMKQGQTYTETFQPTAQQNQVVTVSKGVVEDGSWQVFVGDATNDANLWEQVDNISFETSASQTYSISLDDAGRISFIFGDGTAGAIPADTVTAIYRVTDGADGNAPVGSVKGAVKVELTSPGVGTVSVQMENRDDAATVSGGTQLNTNENQGLTVVSATQSGTLANQPVLSESLVIVITLLGMGGSLTLQDNGLGVFTITANTTGLTLSSSAITYTTGAWSATFSGPMTGGGSILATYFAVIAPSTDTSASIGAATGGQDRETLAELKKNIPAFVRSQGKIITQADYNDNLVQLAGITKSFVDVFVSSYSANLVKVNVWGSEEVTFQSEDSSGLSGSGVAYNRYAQVAADQVTAIQAFLRDRTLLTSSNVILRPGMLWADIYLGTVTYDRRVNPVAVRKSIIENVVAAFEDGSGFVVHLSDIVAAVQASSGVRYFNIERIATGHQNTSAELQGTTALSDTVAGTLESPTVTPGTVVITIMQSATASIVLEDDSAGGFTVVSGAGTLVSGTVDYVTGAWTVTFSATLVENQVVYASYANILEDFRRDQLVTLDAADDNDAWPPPGLAITSPIITPPYKDGVPLSATRAGSPISYPFLADDVLTYDKMTDILVDAAAASSHRYNEEFLYNNEIYYDSVDSVSSDVRAINLRRLIFDLATA